MKKSEVAIMMATYNGEEFLNTQLNSIFNQKFNGHLKLYVRDDGSDDGTKDILKKWGKKFDICLIPNNNERLGPAKSFWDLLQKIPRADFYAFSDQDDLWDEDKLQRATSYLRKQQGPVLWCSNCRVIDKDGNLLFDYLNKEQPIFTIFSQLITGSVQGCSMVFNDDLRTYMKKFNINNKPMHDIFIMIYSLIFGEVFYDSSARFSYRVHSNNVVAKSGKNLFLKVFSSLGNWFGKGRIFQTSKFAVEILDDNRKYLNKDEREYFYNLSHCKFSIKRKFELLNSPYTISTNKRALRSFKVKIILGII